MTYQPFGINLPVVRYVESGRGTGRVRGTSIWGGTGGIWQDGPVPDRRRHRGAHPKDAECFASVELPRLRRAAEDLGWLLSRGYPGKAAVQMVGDRYALRARQRMAIRRATVGEPTRAARARRQVGSAALRGRVLLVDGYNVLLTVETALGGGVVLASRDGVYRDMASMRRHYKRVTQTRPALEAIGSWLAAAQCREVAWYLDRPISNSGRLKKWMEEVAADCGWPWTVELVASPDRVLAGSREIVATADGWILDQCRSWVNLARRVVDGAVPQAWVVDLSGTCLGEEPTGANFDTLGDGGSGRQDSGDPRDVHG